MSQYKIAIAGIGGVGGFYGGLLARTYEGSPEVSISFVARGSHMQAIRDNGLQLERDTESIIARPHHVTDNPKEFGPLNLIIFCCKAYDLEQLALSFSDNITNETILLPLLNGVDSAEVLQGLCPQAQTIYGCTYLFAKKVSDGAVKTTGELNQLLFGSDTVDKAQLERIKDIFGKTGVNVAVSDDIKQKLWEKYSFVSAVATSTSALNSTIREILEDEEKKKTLIQLMEEVVLLSKSEGINLPTNIIDTNLGKLADVPKEATSSMHNDFKDDKRTELETLTGYVVRQSRKWGIVTPVYERLYEQLKMSSTYADTF